MRSASLAPHLRPSFNTSKLTLHGGTWSHLRGVEFLQNLRIGIFYKICAAPLAWAEPSSFGPGGGVTTTLQRRFDPHQRRLQRVVGGAANELIILTVTTNNQQRTIR